MLLIQSFSSEGAFFLPSHENERCIGILGLTPHLQQIAMVSLLARANNDMFQCQVVGICGSSSCADVLDFAPVTIVLPMSSVKSLICGLQHWSDSCCRLGRQSFPQRLEFENYHLRGNFVSVRWSVRRDSRDATSVDRKSLNTTIRLLMQFACFSWRCR